MPYLLEGVKVLDFTRVLAGPFASRILADLGADVVKVEPPEGDMTRGMGRRINGISGYYTQQNVGKRAICVDLTKPGATELMLRLAAEADVVLENFRPGIMSSFGLGWEQLSAVNPRLIMLSISGFGQTGPERDRASYAPIIHGEVGLLQRQQFVDGGDQPRDFALSIADTYTGLHGTVGLLAALNYAQRTGIGQHVDMAMINAMFFTDDYAHFELEQARHRQRRRSGLRRARRPTHAGGRREVVLAGVEHARRSPGPHARRRRPRDEDRAAARGHPGLPPVVHRP